MQKIKVLVVDDSMLIRKILTRLINAQEDMEVIGDAVDPIEARTHLAKNPDVLTLDVEMPRMDGLTFLQKLMKLRPMPVVMVSTLTEKSAAITFKALELGAFDFVTKPKLTPGSADLANGDEILSKIRAAYAARDFYKKMAPPAEPLMPPVHSIHILGGTGANTVYHDVLAQLTSESPPVTLVHTMPAGFAEPFAARLSQHSPVPVVYVSDRATLQPGHVYVLPSERNPQLHLGQSFDVVLGEPGRTLNVSGWAASVGSVAHKHAMMIVLSGADDKDIQGFKLAATQGTMVYGQDPNTAPVPGLIEKLEQAGCLKGIASATALGESIGYLNATIGG